MKKNWKKKIDVLLSLAIITILLPLFITIICQRMRLEEVIYGGLYAAEPTEIMESADPTQATGTAGATETMESTESALGAAPVDAGAMETQLVGIVAKEIGANAEKQAILAQCVVARTNAYDAMARKTAEPEALTMSEMQELWGSDFEAIYRQLESCVSLTQNEVLTWNGDYIYAAYHAISAGKTRSMTEMSAGVKMPYLTELACQADITAEGYLSVSYWQKEEFLQKCQELFPQEELTEIGQLVVQTRDAAGYVEEIKVGDAVYFGEEFRSRLGLNSSCFTIAEADGKVRIVTKGLGHGFGLSQNTAQAMAKEGKSYTEILAHFYPGTKLEKVATN